MNKSWLIKFLVLSVIIAVQVLPALKAQPEIKLEQFWVVLPPAVARNTAGYGVIKNEGNEEDRLIGIQSDSATIMLHKTEVKSGMARMIHRPNMIIKSHSELVLEPMSFHLMLTDLDMTALSERADMVLQFKFEKSGVIDITVPVRETLH